MPPQDSIAERQHGEADSLDDALLQQINKRFTLNLLIQGAAAHTFLTAHHLVRDELEALRPGLTRLYDRVIISAHLCYWIGDMPLMFGPSWWYWRRTGSPRHTFHRHPLLAKYGLELSRASKRYLINRARGRWVITIPGFHYLQTLGLFFSVFWAERKIRRELASLAKRATALIWGIDEDRLDARLTASVAFGNIRRPRTIRGAMLCGGSAGWGGVERRRDRFHVVAKAWFWPFLSHELTKGTAELVCLHGLSDWDEATYADVMRETDHIEHEVPMLQAGAEAWRRLLAVLPTGRPLPEMLMHIARLEPEPLERLMIAVVADPPAARSMLQKLGSDV